MQLLLVILAFNLIIIIHELGHFLAARACGIKVNEFSLFIGPKIFGFKRGDTEYSLRTIPIAAYVKMEGEEEKSESKNSFSKKSVWVKAFVVIAGPLANIFTAMLMFMVVYSFSGFQTYNVNNVYPQSAAYNAGLQKGDVIISYDGYDVYTDKDLYQSMYISKGNPSIVKYKRNGIYNKATIIPEKTIKRYFLGFVGMGDNKVYIESFINDSPLEKAGAKTGDLIESVNGIKVHSAQEVRNVLAISKNKEVAISVIRDNKILNPIQIKPLEKVLNGVYDFGADFEYIESPNFIQAFIHSFKATYSYVRSVPVSLAWLIQGKVSFSQMMGPFGIVVSMNEAVKASPSIKDALLNLLEISALISAAIGATNLIPFPALDGSKLLFYAIEGIRRKPIAVEKEAAISLVGFVILIGFAIIITSKDLFKFFTGTLFNQ